MEIRFLGHSAFELTHDGVDRADRPLADRQPRRPRVSAEEVAADAILVTHGHGDHLGDTVAIAKRTGADVIAIVEIAGELSERGPREGAQPQHRRHRQLRLGQREARAGVAHLDHAKGDRQHARPALIVADRRRDRSTTSATPALFGDLELIGRRHAIDVALIPIGGHFTMDRHDAVEAARMIGAAPGDPLPLRHLPADRDRRAGLQGGGRGLDRERGHRAGARGAPRPVSRARR